METKNQPLFELGPISGSDRADRDAESLKPFFKKHLSGEFGVVSDIAILENRRAIKNRRGLVLSVFQTDDPHVLVITTSFYPELTISSVSFFDELGDDVQSYFSNFITH